ncbi:hypothetical protein HYPBUDRAFT_153944 [Hyphopichia burtonii NRRL Y-1933]|uniref:Protein SIP5 n=1 Tax=Hyphopichia burtonii NRRL Y-1933 TaxID=984485 RepID=A0A1E4RCP5_9ASCO|nr:hypothetical protein HYPBUDRAFT_153944 [Hyphopichia burtonii NRRL Y-1933]ODV65039.1 hypothetical protein HYPBUDRAFT_153944 [Hyphopichia burtonii NRRL Y-1933]
MGNVPAKEGRSRSSSYASSSTNYLESGNSRSARRNTSSSIFSSSFGGDSKKSKTEEKDRQREKHFFNLIVRFEESVDGGFLAPFGTYKSNLDYNTDIVRNLVINRRISPFYTPLQDFNDSWTDDELIIILSQLTLHSIETAYTDEEEVDDIDNHKIHKSTHYYKRQEQKLKLKNLIDKVKQLQKDEENKFLEEKLRLKNGDSNTSSNLPSRDLLLKLYRNASECPICFLYYPVNLNVSRCCRQPICTECFVQIKRLDPHPPHDDTSNEPGSNELPHTIISEPANCPYCAMPDFGVTYESPKQIHTGINGINPSDYQIYNSIPENAISSSPPITQHSNDSPITQLKKPRRRSSIPADSNSVITTDFIRPDWETKLISARNKLARKAATASAIHASNLIIPGEHQSNNGSSTRNQTQSMEERMIEQALRLSLLDEEQRKRKVADQKN